MHVEKYKCTTIYILACIMKLSFQFSQRPKMELMLVTINYNIKLWNSKVQKLKNQQEIIKYYLTNSINNLQITNKRLQKMEIFMANAHANPKFIDQIMDQSEKEQEFNKSLPFMIPSLKLLSTKHNLSFVYKLFEMVNDPDTNSVMIWNKSGTSFFIKDEKGLQDHVKERFDHTMGTFYRKLSEFGFKCVDKFLCEYTNENFQRDNEHMLKNIKSMRKLLVVKRNMKSDMEEELKRLKFFQNELKNNISNIKEKEQSTKCDMLNIKRCLENASKTIECSPSIDSQSQAYGR
ncbi:putative transcription factor HSF-type-DNA-binding family [Helianthus annuus]|uniref:heat stress transcription factor A-2d-like n=1 Tax=Helianthus annuus TaxID=4232 RepID=UPI001652CDEB|nr:heat stress transcription factor A-2d-like [Helianthus annuus]KAJ0522566.1 putative transcription factor HSF-type-DNA-binding family [Helianthus annuus]